MVPRQENPAASALLAQSTTWLPVAPGIVVGRPMPVFTARSSRHAATQATLARRRISSARDLSRAPRVGRRAALVGARGAAGPARRARPAEGAARCVRGLGGSGLERDRPQAEAILRARAGAAPAAPPGGRAAGGPLRRRLVAARVGGGARGGLDRAGRPRTRGAGGALPAVPRRAA